MVFVHSAIRDLPNWKKEKNLQHTISIYLSCHTNKVIHYTILFLFYFCYKIEAMNITFLFTKFQLFDNEKYAYKYGLNLNMI